MIGAVEFDSDGRPCRIVRMHYPAGSVLDQLLQVADRGHRLSEGYIDYCKRDGCYYQHEAGSWTGRLYLGKLVDGARHRLWAHPDITFSRITNDDPLIESEIAELGYDLIDGPTPSLAEFWMTDGVTYYCERCEDSLPEGDPCECVFWCDACGAYWDRWSEPCEHYCGACQVELHTGHCDDCRSAVST